MGKVIAGFPMSLDGFIAAPNDTVPHIFDRHRGPEGWDTRHDPSHQVTHLVHTVRR